MDKFPNELLRKIFIQALPKIPIPFDGGLGDERNHSLVYKHSSQESICTPLYISHVCRHWRNLALSFEKLWSTLIIEIDEEKLEHSRANTIIEVFDTWIERSHSASLNFAFQGHEYSDEAHRVAEHVITILLLHQQRWENMAFHWGCLDLSNNSSGIHVGNMPLLTSLTWVSQFEQGSAVVDISHSPKLRRLKLEGLYGSALALHTGSGLLQNLTELSMIFTGGNEPETCPCLEILKMSPHLVSFRGVFGDKWAPMVLEPGPITCNLRSLHLNGYTVAMELLDNLTLPRLEYLAFWVLREELATVALCRFIERSAPPLKYLQINTEGPDLDNLVPVLPIINQLKILRIRFSTLPTRLFRALTIVSPESIRQPEMGQHTEEDTLCPELWEVDLAWRRVPKPEEADAMDMIQTLTNMLWSRWKDNRIFKSFFPPGEENRNRDDINWRDMLAHIEKNRGYLTVGMRRFRA